MVNMAVPMDKIKFDVERKIDIEIKIEVTDN